MGVGTKAALAKRRRWMTRDHWRFAAKELQRKGQTLSEIAVQLDVPRDDVVRVLYWESVQ